MDMAANIVEYTVNPEQADTLRARVQAHLVSTARQAPGYRGFLLLDRGLGKRLALVLFESAAAAQAAQAILAPVGIEQTGALMQGAIERSVGTVLINDGVFADAVVR